MIVVHPALYVEAEFLFPLGIAHAIAATRQLFYAATHLGFGLGMYRQKALALVDVERVTEVLHPTDIGDYCLFLVDL